MWVKRIPPTDPYSPATPQYTKTGHTQDYPTSLLPTGCTREHPLSLTPNPHSPAIHTQEARTGPDWPCCSTTPRCHLSVLALPPHNVTWLCLACSLMVTIGLDFDCCPMATTGLDLACSLPLCTRQLRWHLHRILKYIVAPLM